MALPATDSFTNSNGTQLNSHNANWTEYNGFDIQSNAAHPDISADEAAANWTGDTFDNDQYSEGTITSLASGTYVGVLVRSNSSSTYYGYYTDSGDAAYLFKMVAGSWTELGSGGVLSATDTMRLEANGTTLTPKVNGSLDSDVGAQTDSAISSGDAGVTGYNNDSSYIDDWTGDNLGGAAPAPSVSDTVTVAESITVTLPDALTPSASDAVTVAEAISRVLESFIAASDAVSVADTPAVSVQATATPAVNVSDAVAVAESIGRALVSHVSVSDAIAVAESVALALVSNVTVSDTVTVAESIGTLLTSFVNISDAVSVAEDVTISIGAAGAFEINVSDTVTVGESDSADVSDPQVSVSEAVGVAESVGVSVVTGYSVSVSDAITVAEAVTPTIADLALSVSESVSVAETVGRLLTSYIGVSDSVAVADSPAVSVAVPGADRNISVSDSVSVSDVAVIAVFLAAGPPGLRVASSGIAAIRAGPQIVGTVRTAGTDGPLIRNTDETG